MSRSPCSSSERSAGPGEEGHVVTGEPSQRRRSEAVERRKGAAFPAREAGEPGGDDMRRVEKIGHIEHLEAGPGQTATALPLRERWTDREWHESRRVLQPAGQAVAQADQGIG